MKSKTAFTLIELLAVIVILGILLLIAVPAISNVIENFKERAFIVDANTFIEQANYTAIAEEKKGSYFYKLQDLVTEDIISPYGAKYDKNSIIVYSDGTSNIEKGFYIFLTDEKNNSIGTVANDTFYVEKVVEANITNKKITSNVGQLLENVNIQISNAERYVNIASDGTTFDLLPSGSIVWLKDNKGTIKPFMVLQDNYDQVRLLQKLNTTQDKEHDSYYSKKDFNGIGKIRDKFANKYDNIATSSITLLSTIDLYNFLKNDTSYKSNYLKLGNFLVQSTEKDYSDIEEEKSAESLKTFGDYYWLSDENCNINNQKNQGKCPCLSLASEEILTSCNVTQKFFEVKNEKTGMYSKVYFLSPMVITVIKREDICLDNECECVLGEICNE